MDQQLKSEGCYPVKGPIDLAVTSMQTMMDANLALQIKSALRAKGGASGGAPLPVVQPSRQWESGHDDPEEDAADAPPATPTASPLARPPPPGLFALAPEIITLCGGSLSPFDFALNKEQHLDLYQAGQLCTHLIAEQLEPPDTAEAVMSAEGRLKSLLLLLHLDYPAKD